MSVEHLYILCQGLRPLQMHRQRLGWAGTDPIQVGAWFGQISLQTGMFYKLHSHEGFVDLINA